MANQDKGNTVVLKWERHWIFLRHPREEVISNSKGENSRGGNGNHKTEKRQTGSLVTLTAGHFPVVKLPIGWGLPEGLAPPGQKKCWGTPIQILAGGAWSPETQGVVE